MRAQDLGLMTQLKNVTSLEYIDFYGNICTNDDGVSVAAYRDLSPFSGIHNLRYLDIGNSPLNNVGAVKNNPSLKYINLEETDISRPNCTAQLRGGINLFLSASCNTANP